MALGTQQLKEGYSCVVGNSDRPELLIILEKLSQCALDRMRSCAL
jgi:hypothetical protein